jgi:hypothetical protein
MFTVRSHHRNKAVNVLCNRAAVRSENCTKPINTFCGRHVKLVNVKIGGTYSVITAGP